MHIIGMGLLAGLLGASSATAATVADYYASSSISVALVSATYETSGEDATAALRNTYWDDQGDYGGYSGGTGQVENISGGSAWHQQGATEYTVARAVSGYASETDTYGWSGFGEYYLPAFHYGCSWQSQDCSGGDRIVMELGYSLETEADATIHDPLTGNASAQASALLEISVQDLGRVYPDSTRTNVLRTRANGTSSVSGRYFATLDPGLFLTMFLYSESVTGEASYSAPPGDTGSAPIPTPLPAGIPLTLSALALLGLLARRGKAA